MSSSSSSQSSSSPLSWLSGVEGAEVGEGEEEVEEPLRRGGMSSDGMKDGSTLEVGTGALAEDEEGEEVLVAGDKVTAAEFALSVALTETDVVSAGAEEEGAGPPKRGIVRVSIVE